MQDLIATSTGFILQLAILIVAAMGGGLVFKRFGYPTILGELIVGILLGPFALGVIRFTEFLTLFSELGAVILLFYIGLETEIEKLKKFIIPSVIVGVAGAILPFILGYLVVQFLGFSKTEALFIGTVLMATSLGITVGMLRDMNLLETKEGMTILGAGVIDDVVAVVALTIILGVAEGSFSPVNAVVLTSKAVGFWVVTLLLGIRFFPRLFDRLSISMEAFSLSALALALLFASISAQMGLSTIIGAFAVGVALSKIKRQQELLVSLKSIFILFVPIFFVSIGMLVNLQVFTTSLLLGLILTGLAVAGKVVGATVAAWALHLGGMASLRIGVGMMPRGEMGLIVASIGLASGFISGEIYSASIIVVLITTIVALPTLKFLFK